MDGGPEPPEADNRDSDTSEGGGSSAHQSPAESGSSRSGSEAEVAEEIAIEEAAPEAPAAAEPEGEEAPGAGEEPAEARGAPEEEQQEPGEEAEGPAQPLTEGDTEEAEAEAAAEAAAEQERAEQEGAEEEEKMKEEAAADEDEEEEPEEEEEGEEEEEDAAAEAAYMLRKKKTLSRGLSLQDLEAVVAHKAGLGEARGEEEEGDEAAGWSALRAPLPRERRLDSAWTLEMRKEQEEQLRAELLQQYSALMAERSRYQRYNFFLQHKISEALRKKKGQDAAEAAGRAGPEPESPEKEQAYLGYVTVLEDLRKQQEDDLAWYHEELDQLKQQCRYTLEHAERDWRKFQALKKQVVLQVLGSGRMTGGRQEALRQVEQIQALEDKKEKEISAVRLENVQLKQCLVHFETRMRAQEDLTQGLHLIDFEQLKIENQTFNEKVEERNEELQKLRDKVSNNVQIVTHVKEKLHFVDSENLSKKVQLQEMEAQVALKRDILTRTKQARDNLRLENLKLNQRCGLLGKHALLQDLEDRVEKTELLRARLESLTQHHASLMLSCRGMKQKIREARTFFSS